MQQAQAEELTLTVAGNEAGYFGVSLANPGQPKPYQARVRRGGKGVSLSYFATAEEAALCVAQSLEGQTAAERAAAALPLTGVDGGGEEADEEAIEVDALEVNAWSDDEEEALVVEAEEVTLIVETDASASASAFGALSSTRRPDTCAAACASAFASASASA